MNPFTLLCSARRGGWLLLLAWPLAAQTARPLTLEEAVQQALDSNLQSVMAREQVAQARGQKGVALSALLPNLSASASQSSITSNLAAMGLPVEKMAGFPAFVGPFNHFDARFALVQNIFNLAAIRRYQSGNLGVELAREQQRLAAEQIAAATAIAYVSALSGEQGVAAAEANLQLAERLLDLARTQKQAGLAAGIDVVRAETRLANQRVGLAQAQTRLDTARLELARITGAPLGESVALVDRLKLSPVAGEKAESAVATAQSDRPDAAVARQALRIAESQRKAATAGLLPSVSAFGDYGSSGLKPNEMNLPTRTIGVRLDVPVFDGGRTRSEMQIAASRQREAEAQLRDVGRAVEKDVRQALLNLKTREAQALAAQTALALATRELELARDRFAHGLADNVEVVNAQAALENARLAEVAGLAEFNLARLNLASALGHAGDFRL